MAMVGPGLVLECVRERFLLSVCKVSESYIELALEPQRRYGKRTEISSEALTDLMFVSGYAGGSLEGVRCEHIHQ